MSQPQVWTYSDALEYLSDFTQARSQSASQGVLRQCIQAAYREILSARDWVSMLATGHIELQATLATGTLTYDASTRTCVLSGTTVPDWAIDATVRIADANYEIESVVDATSFTLRSGACPQADITTGVEYSLFRPWYELPDDFASLWLPSDNQALFIGEPVSMEQMFLEQRRRFTTGTPRRYAIGPAPNQLGRLAMYVWPLSDAHIVYPFLYKRRMRDLKVSGHDAWTFAGTVSVAEGGTSVVGTSTTFDDRMEGAVIRFSANTTLPTSIEGANPYAEQRSVLSVEDATHLTLAEPAEATYSGVKYLVSDPLDMNVALLDALLRGAESNFARTRALDNAGVIFRAYREAIDRARSEDGRLRQPAAILEGNRYPDRLTYYPRIHPS